MIRYNIQTVNAARKLYAELTESSIVDDESYSRLVNAFRGQKIQIVCRHLTSSIDGCSSIKEKGLVGWSDVMSDKTTHLSRVLAEIGIFYTDDRLVYKSGDRKKDLTSVIGLRHLQIDDCINAYLHCSKNDEGYSKSPEILRSLANSLSCNCLSKMVNSWEEGAEPYCAEFSVSPNDIDVITDWYSANSDDLSCMNKALSNLLLDVIENRYPRNHPVILKKGVTIPPNRLIISKFDEIDWDFEME